MFGRGTCRFKHHCDLVAVVTVAFLTLLDELEADARRKGAEVFMSAAVVEQCDGAVGRVYQGPGVKPLENPYARKLSS
jgi:hypothetical protein